MAEGTHPCTLTFNENSTHAGSTVGISVTLYRLNSTVSSSDLTYIYRQSGILTAYVIDSNGNPIQNEDVRFLINSTRYRILKTNEDGRVDFDLSRILDIGSYPIDIFFDPTDRYRNSTVHVNVVVNKVPTVISMSDLLFTDNGDRYLVVTLKDNKGTPVIDQDISIKLTNRQLIKRTDKDGQVKLLINLPPENYTATISYSGNGIFNSSYFTCPIEITEDGGVIPIDNSSGNGSVPIDNSSGNGSGPIDNASGNNSNGTTNSGTEEIPAKITADDANNANADGEYMTVTLKDDSGNVMSNRMVAVNINGQTKNYKTDSKGQFRLYIGSLVPKTYGAKVSLLGSDGKSLATFNVKIVVKKSKPKLIASKKKFKAKSTKKYKVTLKNNKNVAIKKAKIYLKIKGKTYIAKTNKKGVATFKIKKLTKMGKYTAKVKFKGNAYYTAVSKKVKITVKK